jgi:hypothetical protein
LNYGNIELYYNVYGGTEIKHQHKVVIQYS